MKQTVVSFLFSLYCIATSAQLNKQYLNYIEQYKHIAVQQMQKYKIPASITLAQGIFESGAGMSDLARMSNNHFGIKCGGDWKGRSVRHDDDKHKECFRYYDSPQESYEDHSLFLLGRSWYAPLFKLDIHDYKGWARGLKKAGYATNPQYANRLIDLIEQYELYQYDNWEERKKPKHKPSIDVVEYQPTTEDYHLPQFAIESRKILFCNEVPYIVVQRGDDLQQISKEFRIKRSHLVVFNDLHDDYVLQAGERIYLRKKKKHASDEDGYIYVVKNGDSMHTVAQLFAIRLRKLQKLNKNIVDDATLHIGTILRIH